MKDVFVIGGPNGAGKTTAASRLLPKTLELREFLNADEIARGLSPFDPEANAVPAGRMMIERIDRLVEEGRSFAFETTCAGHRQAKLLRSCRVAGYRITFIYLWLPSAQMAISRVAQRVARGGHHIPEDVITRRYSAGIHNMRHTFLPLADIAAIYDNSIEPPVLIGERESSSPFRVLDATRWRLIEDASG
jgi:predicted ABC-type ATPase